MIQTRENTAPVGKKSSAFSNSDTARRTTHVLHCNATYHFGYFLSRSCGFTIQVQQDRNLAYDP